MNTYEDHIKNIVHTIKYSCIGVVIYKRGKKDNHLCFSILTEDDGNWSAENGSFSTFWLKEYQKVLFDLLTWLDTSTNVEKEEWGWKVIND